MSAVVPDDGKYPKQVSERYEVGEAIGDGNFAVVHECVERMTGSKFALKIIDKTKCLGKVAHCFSLRARLLSLVWRKVPCCKYCSNSFCNLVKRGTPQVWR